MIRSRGLLAGRGVLLFLLAALAAPARGEAQQGGPGFSFTQPRVTVRAETGYGVRFANSEIFDLTRDELTVSRSDFDAPYLGGEIAVRVQDRWDVALGFGWMQSRVDSEFRDWVDDSDNPIEQLTELRTIPFTLTGKYYLSERGRSVGRFAWVPASGLTPYVGGGLGVVSYRFEQVGDFVDFETFDIFYDRFSSTGQTLVVRGLAGATLSLGSMLELSGEARYSYASAEMSSDFDGFDPMSLSALQFVVGVGLRF